MDDLATMLRALGDLGWRPVLYVEAGGREWVCYPQARVRTFAAFRGADPLRVVQQLWAHTLAHPEVCPDPPAPVGPPLGVWA